MPHRARRHAPARRTRGREVRDEHRCWICGSPDPVLLLDSKGRCRHVSDSALACLGLGRDQALAASADELGVPRAANTDAAGASSRLRSDVVRLAGGAELVRLRPPGEARRRALTSVDPSR
jgi:hypothetical protein